MEWCKRAASSKTVWQKSSFHLNVCKWLWSTHNPVDLTWLFLLHFLQFSTDAVFPHGLSNCSEDADMKEYACKLDDGYVWLVLRIKILKYSYQFEISWKDTRSYECPCLLYVMLPNGKCHFKALHLLSVVFSKAEKEHTSIVRFCVHWSC